MTSDESGPDAATRRFLAFVAHEIQSPLTRIERLAARLDAADPAERTLSAEVIRREAGHARRLAADLIAWAAIDAGEPGESVPVDTLIAEAASAVDPSDATVEVQVEVRGAVPLVPAALVRPLLRNLLENAVRAGAARAPVAVAIRVLDRNGRVVIEVEDHGPGLPAELAADPFRPFAKGAGGGSGLGLSIVAAAANRLGWSVTVLNRPGEGVLYRFGTDFGGN